MDFVTAVNEISCECELGISGLQINVLKNVSSEENEY